MDQMDQKKVRIVDGKPRRSSSLLYSGLMAVATLLSLPVWAASNTATIDCNELAYPPNVLERGFRRNFDQEDTSSTEGSIKQIDRAGQRGFGLVNGTIELNTVRSSMNHSYVGSPNAEFYKVGGVVTSRVDANLTAVRQRAKQNRMLILSQMMGTPKSTGGSELFTIDPVYFDKYPSMPDFAPLPIVGGLDHFSTALSGYFCSIAQCDESVLNATHDSDYLNPVSGRLGFPTIWIGSQEPEHTLGYTDDILPLDGYGDDSAAKSNENDKRYIRFWSKVAKKMKTDLPDARVGGIQQNGMEGEFDRYKIASNYWMEWETSQNDTYPIDYFTIQNYKDPSLMPTIMANARKAMTTSTDTSARSHEAVRKRFSKTPILFDRWSHFLDPTGAMRDTEKNTSTGIVSFLTGERIIIDQPDVYGYCAEALGFEKNAGWMLADLGAFLIRMPAERRPISFAGGSSADLDGIAAANDLGAYVVVWNKSAATTHNLTLNLNGLVPFGSWTDAAHLTVQRGSGVDYPDSMAAPTLTILGGHAYQITGIALPPETFVTIRWDADSVGSTPYADELDAYGLDGLRYTAHNIYCDRQDGSTAIPHGMGQYSQRSGILTAAVNDSSGTGLAGAVFRQVPVSRMLEMYFSSENLSLSGDGTTKLQMRIDYLDGDSVLKTVLLRPSNFANADTAFWTGLDWNTIGSAVETVSQPLGTAGQLLWDVGANAPDPWAQAAENNRGLMVSLLLTNVSGASASSPAMVRVRLADEEAFYTSEGTLDGYILESTSTAGEGGTATSTGNGTQGLRVGDDAANLQYKSIVSFDTSTIPSWAEIDEVSLYLTRGFKTGDPSVLGSLKADIRSGNWSGNAALEAKDFEAIGQGAGVMIFTPTVPTSNGDLAIGSLSSANFSKINRDGNTQFRIRFATTASDTDDTNDFIGFYSGSYPTDDSYRPHLVVKYHHRP